MLNRRHMLMTAGALTLGGCATAQPAPPPMAAAPPPPAPSPPVAPPPSPQQQLTSLLDTFFQENLADSPELATSLGLDKGANAAAKSKFSDSSIAGQESDKARAIDQLRRLRALDRRALSGMAAVNYDTVLFSLETRVAAAQRFVYGGGASNPYILTQISGAWQDAPDFLAHQHTIETAADCEAYVARLEALSVVFDQEVERTRRDGALGVIPPDFALKGALGGMRRLNVGGAQSPLVAALVDRAKEKGISGDWQGLASRAYEGKVRPALGRQMALLTEMQGKAVHDAGCWRLPDGAEYYAMSLAAQTTTRRTPAEVHKLGLDVTAELSARADVLFKQLGMTRGTVGQRYDGLYKKKTGIYPNTDKDKARLVDDLNKLSKQMEARLPEMFATIPKTPLEIRRIPRETEQGASTHYSAGSLDGTRPGIYWINLRDTAEAPFWWMPTTTFHEGFPGHHMQIALQREADLPMIRRAGGFGAYAEGWGLYVEQVAQEMDFYKGNPLWELGYIHDALLRSGRLVTDTGLHHLRWSREKAITTLSGIDGDPVSLSTQEIERYSVWPGQACSYMVGKVEIIRLREKAKAALGPRFDIRQFHDAVLLSGSMPLTVLEAVIDNHIAARAAGQA